MLSESYKIGFLWGNGAVAQNFFRVTFQDAEFLEELCEGTRKISSVNVREKGTFVIYFPLQAEIICKLMSLGWTGRFDKERQYPRGVFDELEFIRGYCKTKLNIKQQKRTTKAYGVYYTDCLRIYGSLNIVKKIDAYFCSVIGMEPKKIQQVCSTVDRLYEGSTCYVSYAACKDCKKILALLNR